MGKNYLLTTNRIGQPMRLPILAPETWPAWLGEQLVSPDRLKSLLKPFDPERMECWPVGKRVGNVANDDAGLIDRI